MGKRRALPHAPMHPYAHGPSLDPWVHGSMGRMAPSPRCRLQLSSRRVRSCSPIAAAARWVPRTRSWRWTTVLPPAPTAPSSTSSCPATVTSSSSTTRRSIGRRTRAVLSRDGPSRSLPRSTRPARYGVDLEHAWSGRARRRADAGRRPRPLPGTRVDHRNERGEPGARFGRRRRRPPRARDGARLPGIVFSRGPGRGTTRRPRRSRPAPAATRACARCSDRGFTSHQAQWPTTRFRCPSAPVAFASCRAASCARCIDRAVPCRCGRSTRRWICDAFLHTASTG